MTGIPMLEGRLESLRLYLHLTMRCNLSCSYCYGNARRSDTMPLQVARDAVDFFLPRARHLMLQFFGGEPLLQFGMLKEVVAYAEEQAGRQGTPVSFVTVTNGTLLTAEVVDFLAAHRIDVSLSLDGGAAAQDAGRRFPDGRGSFAAVEANLDRALSRLRSVHVVSVVTPDNVSRLAESVQYLLGKGIRSIALSVDYSDPRLPDVVPELERQLDAAAATYLASLRQGKRTHVDLFDDSSNPYARGRCRLGERDFSVDPTGRIYPCCCFVDRESFPVGSIYGGIDPAEAAALDEAVAELRRHIAEVHRDCPEGAFCRKGCGCTNVVATGSPSRVVPVTCTISRAVARVQARLREARSLTSPGPLPLPPAPTSS